MLITPYKENLIDLIAAPDVRPELFSYVAGLRSIQLTERETCDLELLSTGAFSPLQSFMGEGDYNRVLDEMRLSDGTVFPIPITLSTHDLTNLAVGRDIALRDPKNDLLAVMNIGEIYEWNFENLAETVFGTTDARHPAAAEMQSAGRFNLSGKLQVLKLPEYRDFQTLRLTPKQTREHLHGLGRKNVVAFQTRNPLHRGHEFMTQRAIEMIDGTLLLHPVVGITKKGDIDRFTRVRTFEAIVDVAFPKDRVLLSLIPLAMRMAGPREAVWHAIIRRNYGANHLIVGRDHASPGTDAKGKPFYEPFAAQKLASQLSAEIGVKILEFNEVRYLPEERQYEEVDKIPAGRRSVSLSGTRLRNDFLSKGRKLPEWFARKEVAKILSESYLPKCRQGVCVWLTGLSGAGKSTTAEVLTTLLQEEGRQVSLLDGDVVRTHLSKGLGFSRADRDANISRIGFVASEIVRHGGIVICAAVSPYRHSRGQVRLMFGHEQFIEVFVDTPLVECERRDVKGMYAKARRGEITNLTGIDDIYEVPAAAEITLGTVNKTAFENARIIIDHLRSKGFLKPQTPDKKNGNRRSTRTACVDLLDQGVLCSQ